MLIHKETDWLLRDVAREDAIIFSHLQRIKQLLPPIDNGYSVGNKCIVRVPKIWSRPTLPPHPTNDDLERIITYEFVLKRHKVGGNCFDQWSFIGEIIFDD